MMEVYGFWDSKQLFFVNMEMERRKYTLESGIDIGHGINVGPGKFYKNNKLRALNKCRAWKK